MFPLPGCGKREVPFEEACHEDRVTETARLESWVVRPLQGQEPRELDRATSFQDLTLPTHFARGFRR